MSRHDWQGRCRPSLRWPASALLAVVLGGALGACSINFPMSSLVNDPDVTASIVAPASPSQLGLSEDDWVQASVALDKALDPQQTGTGVRWANAESGRGGSFVAAGPAFVRNDQVCRLFKASLVQAPQDQHLLGTACRVGGGTWSLQKVKPLPAGV